MAPDSRHRGPQSEFAYILQNHFLKTVCFEDDVEYVNFVEAGVHLAEELRSMGAEIVIALTHMRLPNDELLCREVPEIDLVLGGHDHNYFCKQVT